MSIFKVLCGPPCHLPLTDAFLQTSVPSLYTRISIEPLELTVHYIADLSTLQSQRHPFKEIYWVLHMLRMCKSPEMSAYVHPPTPD